MGRETEEEVLNFEYNYKDRPEEQKIIPLNEGLVSIVLRWRRRW